jgi:hypothetical protein
VYKKCAWSDLWPNGNYVECQENTKSNMTGRTPIAYGFIGIMGDREVSVGTSDSKTLDNYAQLLKAYESEGLDFTKVNDFGYTTMDFFDVILEMVVTKKQLGTYYSEVYFANKNHDRNEKHIKREYRRLARGGKLLGVIGYKLFHVQQHWVARDPNFFNPELCEKIRSTMQFVEECQKLSMADRRKAVDAKYYTSRDDYYYE